MKKTSMLFVGHNNNNDRKDNCFSYPSIEDWNKIKPFLKTIKFDKELTYQIEKDWKE